MHQLAVELGSKDRGWRNSLKACAMLVIVVVVVVVVVIESDE
jgi:hypothetical protein